MSSDLEERKKLLAAAVIRKQALARQHAFDPMQIDSKPTVVQQQVLDDFGKVPQQWIRAANQCLVEGTLVATPTGPKSIESIRAGDTVYSEHGKEIKVLKTFANGVKEVADLTCRRVPWVTCTKDHAFQLYNTNDNLVEKKACSFGRDDAVVRVTVTSPLGEVNNPEAYALAALLGDGCSRQKGKQIQISSGTPHVPMKVADILGSAATKLSEFNYTWAVGSKEPQYYTEWCKNRYAHEKIVDLDIIKTWDRESLLSFVAGLIDTDGSVYPAKDHVTLSLDMQAKSVVDAFDYAVLALWQVPMNRTIDDRAKYKNGPVHSSYIRQVHLIKHILKELDPYLISPQKKWREEYETLGGKRSSGDKVSLKFGSNPRLAQTYDIHVDSPTNLYLLANGLVTHNSGKSAVCARIVSWVAQENYPNWSRPPHWGNEPLLIIVAGRTGKQIEESLIPKIRNYLEAGTFKEVRTGNMIQRIEFNNGNRIVFQSLENANLAQQRVQSYVAHLVWIDEMPSTLAIVRELLVRVQARNGYFLASFTPTVVNIDIQRFVDSIKMPEGKVYRFSMLDNPLYSDPERKQQLLSRYAMLPDHVRRAIFEGDWLQSDDLVYHFSYDHTVRDLPSHYSRAWRHVESVDPALKSALGITLWAEDPIEGKWYCVVADYIKNVAAPTLMVEAVSRYTVGYNIVLRISDYAPWFTEQARLQYNKTYTTVQSKNLDRKSDLIKQLQQHLTDGSIYITPNCQNLIDELQTCRWAPGQEGTIINRQSYHLLDSAQYFVDGKPHKMAGNISQFTAETWHAYIREGNEKIEKREQAAKFRVIKQGLRKLQQNKRRNQRVKGWR